MTVWFGSDLHFDHKNILSFCNRPYTSLEEMKEGFFKEMKDKYYKGDTVYLLGDIVFKNHEEILDRLSSIMSNTHLIIGNHDHNKTINPKYWKSVKSYDKISINKRKIILFHFPIEEWDCKDHGSLHFHGHTHGGMSKHGFSSIKNRIDVGYDNTNQVIIDYNDLLKLNNE